MDVAADGGVMGGWATLHRAVSGVLCGRISGGGGLAAEVCWVS